MTDPEHPTWRKPLSDADPVDALEIEKQQGEGEAKRRERMNLDYEIESGIW